MEGDWRTLCDSLAGKAAGAAVEALLAPAPGDITLVSPGFDLPPPDEGEIDWGMRPEANEAAPQRWFVSPQARRLQRQLSLHADATAFIGALEVPVGPGTEE